MPNDNLSLSTWCEQCLATVMPAQRNGNRPKYSEEALQRYREIVSQRIVPQLGQTPVAKLEKAAVAVFAEGLESDEIRSQTLNVLTRIMELAEIKGKRRKGTSPCKGVPLSVTKKPGGRFAERPKQSDTNESGA